MLLQDQKHVIPYSFAKSVHNFILRITGVCLNFISVIVMPTIIVKIAQLKVGFRDFLESRWGIPFAAADIHVFIYLVHRKSPYVHLRTACWTWIS